MKNQVDYFKKNIKILEELKKDYPDMDISQHYSLATDCGNFLTDKELFQALQKHKGELDMNTLSNEDTDEVIASTEDLFREVDPEDEEWEEDEEID